MLAFGCNQYTFGSSVTLYKSLLSLSILSAMSSAYAQQESPKIPLPDDMEVIEIRGIRASLAENLDVKRMASSVVDAITAEDIGKFPDKKCR